MTDEERDRREEWLASSRGRKGLRIVIVTENFLPKVDGVTRTLSRLLVHLQSSGHSCILLGPSSSITTYASHPIIGTLGIPLYCYPGLKLNFARPKFWEVVKSWEPDVVHFVDPIWLGAQMICGMGWGLGGQKWVEGGRELGGAVVASYHTNLATYATLFNLPFLTPLIWSFQRLLHSRVRLTLCPSPSTKAMLEEQGWMSDEGGEIGRVRIWSRGVDLHQFGRSKRSWKRRKMWGVGLAPGEKQNENDLLHRVEGGDPAIVIRKEEDGVKVVGLHWNGCKEKGIMTPPSSPENGPEDKKAYQSQPQPHCNLYAPYERGDGQRSFKADLAGGHPGTNLDLPERVVLLYVGRISWEKNIHLLLSAYSHLSSFLPSSSFSSPNHVNLMPKLIFVGDGPARKELEAKCKEANYDAEFLGHKQGEELAECYASADVFAFPSFTETFGQVVLEALASGLPVVGLDAEGTRDLVTHRTTGLLLSPPHSHSPGHSKQESTSIPWPKACSTSSPHFQTVSKEYAKLLAEVVLDHQKRKEMGQRGSTEGITGRTWWDAMEKCVDSYREAMRIARSKRSIRIVPHSLTSPETLIPSFDLDPTVIGDNDYFLDEKRRQGSFVNRFGLTNKSFTQRGFGKRERVGKNFMRRENNGLFWIMSESCLNFPCPYRFD
ncbi:hypothetical protein I314_05162 [Cryptococcus bacillisporus CA1873]|uniref:Glycosyl transferase family 1 domain-containing protein n=1 Tax=Cryptococcus bacillisporus CA1873 TaxID=1296111 RepID=A0ABR5B6E1_CRYGA|nr:hypothetical protein I314_05162 [Cryptococcus bacillisporus CA1873]|eukprot:KIR59176.1 hypothetical protein I314_05162 [Cryptococcus gattii CA1873]